MPAHHTSNSEAELFKENVLGPVTVSAPSANTVIGVQSGFAQATTIKPELVVTGITGTTPVFKVALQSSQDGGATWNAISSGTFTDTSGSTNLNQELAALTGPFEDQIRAIITSATGTTPAATLQVNIASYITDNQA